MSAIGTKSHLLNRRFDHLRKKTDNYYYTEEEEELLDWEETEGHIELMKMRGMGSTIKLKRWGPVSLATGKYSGSVVCDPHNTIERYNMQVNKRPLMGLGLAHRGGDLMSIVNWIQLLSDGY